ncbi:MAG TPA: YvcK family protein [Terriglobales bacterium]|nr:YvcK family protein [Terriglobales bacterium]
MLREPASIKVVAIGGGTGLSTLLKGLKHFDRPGAHRDAQSGREIVVGDLTAIVTVTDDGGSSGRLRKEFGILPPGDIRNCLVALSEDEELLSQLFQYRFKAGAGLEGHNFGNLFVTALTEITGDFAMAVKVSSAILKTRGVIYPSTVSNVQLEALMDDGSRVRGETTITRSKQRVVELYMIPPDAQPLPQALEAIANADLITLGPGSLYTSLISNLIVSGIPQAIAASRAVKIFVCNLMTQANESLGLTAADHLRALDDHAKSQIFDYALVNTSPVSDELKQKYAAEGAEQIHIDLDAIRKMGVEPICGDFLEEEAGVARHATDRLAMALLDIAVSARHSALSQKR